MMARCMVFSRNRRPNNFGLPNNLSVSLSSSCRQAILLIACILKVVQSPGRNMNCNNSVEGSPAQGAAISKLEHCAKLSNNTLKAATVAVV